MCTWKAARDIHSGLNLQPGCQTLNGDMALAYARSRYYEEWDGTDWQIDPRADLGRIERQQLFIREAVNGMLQRHRVVAVRLPATRSRPSPTRCGSIPARPDQGRASAAQGGRRQGSTRTRCPVENDTVGDAAVLRLGDGADALLAYFRGEGPAPTQFETVTDPALDAAAASGASEHRADRPSPRLRPS